MTSFQPRDPNQIGVAFLGVGRMGMTHLQNLAGIRNANVVVVADPDLDAARRGQEASLAGRATTDTLDAIHDPAVEAVVIVTPTSTHAELIEAALNAGKAIWTEKPIALSVAETNRVVEIWRETGLPVQLGFMRRFDPGYVRAKALIDAGELGRIEQFRSASRDTFMPPVSFIKKSGGSFLDMSVHDFDLARFLVGEIDEVSAWGANIIDDRFAEGGDIDTAVTMLRFENGALGVVEMSRRSAWGYDIRTEVAGATGKVVVEAPRKTDATFSRRFGFEGDHYESFPDRFEVAYRVELEAFFKTLAEGGTPDPGPEDALATLKVAVAARTSWEEKRPVRVAEISATATAVP
jgi:myo-inositol 2-dehydrogenase/D-chiro-inositol 1-dehydrogenase